MARARRRTKRRAQARQREKLASDLERLARLAPGGAPDRPIPVGAVPQVDVIAEQTRCPVCRVPLRLEQHLATTVDGVRLRVAEVVCVACRRRRSLYFRLDLEALH
jgi:hypothetical protein